MEFFTAIALLCQVTSHSINGPSPVEALQCQQSYIHCVNTKSNKETLQERLERCVLERKI